MGKAQNIRPKHKARCFWNTNNKKVEVEFEKLQKYKNNKIEIQNV